MIYIAIIQMCLFIQALLCIFCELATPFSDSLKSVIIRYSISLSLFVVGYYANYLDGVPYQILFCIFVLAIASTFYTAKHIFHEYAKRKRRQEKLMLAKTSRK